MLRTIVIVLMCAWGVNASAQVPNHAAVLEHYRSLYPAQVTQKQAGEILAQTVWAIRTEGFGLLKKTGGNRCPIPNSTTTVSCDWILHRPSGLGCDALIDAPSMTSLGKASPHWCSKWEAADMSKFVTPVDPGTGPTPEPPDEDLDERVAALETQVKTLTAKTVTQSQQISALEKDVVSLHDSVVALTGAEAAIMKRLEELEQQIQGGCVATNITSSREWGHSHTVKACAGK